MDSFLSFPTFQNEKSYVKQQQVISWEKGTWNAYLKSEGFSLGKRKQKTTFSLNWGSALKFILNPKKQFAQVISNPPPPKTYPFPPRSSPFPPQPSPWSPTKSPPRIPLRSPPLSPPRIPLRSPPRIPLRSPPLSPPKSPPPIPPRPRPPPPIPPKSPPPFPPISPPPAPPLSPPPLPPSSPPPLPPLSPPPSPPLSPPPSLPLPPSPFPPTSPPASPLPSPSLSRQPPLPPLPPLPSPSPTIPTLPPTPGSLVPGPVCGGIGKCCSNQQQEFLAGTPLMSSTWWNSQMAHGAKVQIRASSWARWWTPLDGVQWNGPITQLKSSMPSIEVFFTVIRVSNTQIKLLTVDGTYIYAAPPNPLIDATYGTMAATTNGSDPRTILTLSPVPGRPYSVYMKCSDGKYISADGNGHLLRWSTGTGTWERNDILEVMQVPAIRGPNLGSWLVMEQWMVPNLYSKPAPYNDGTGVQIQSIGTGLWLSSGNISSSQITSCQGPLQEIFHIERSTSGYGSFRFKTWWLKYWSMANGMDPLITGDATLVGTEGQEDFMLTFQSSSSRLALIKAPNGKYIRAWASGNLTADVDPSTVSLSNSATWTGPLAFSILMVEAANGEWQCSNELGATNASETFGRHHNTFMQESDWIFLQESGANTVRLPVGWWAKERNPYPSTPFQEWTYNPGTTLKLDWAFSMALKYNIRIFLSIHGAPGSQSGWGNTGTRSGMVEWHLPENVNATLNLVDWLCQRYVSNPMFLGMTLLNEPTIDVPNRIAQKFYMDAYDIVRSYSQCLYVSIEARIGSNEWSDVIWLMNDVFHTNVMVEVHAYNVFGGVNATNADQEIQWVKTVRLKQILDLQQTGRSILIGEFSNAMKNSASAQQQATFSLAQLQTFAQATSGWFFWSLKLQRSGYDHWQWYKSLGNGWLPKNPATGTWY